VGTATRSLAVGARVPHARAGLGAVAIMAIADARLGQMALRLLELGYKAPAVVEELVRADPYAEYRQLGVIDGDGFAAARTGQKNREWAGQRVREDYIVLGNYLTGEHILEAMERAFTARPDEDLEERLLRGIEAGRDAGGQHGGQQSAALLVYEDRAFAHVDLRVDVHPEPVGELRRVFDAYRPAIPLLQPAPGRRAGAAAARLAARPAALRPGRRQRPAARIARHTRSGVTGISRCSTPRWARASTTTLTTAPSAGVVPPSPPPRSPSGFEVDSTSLISVANDGSRSARGIA
jgi:uncharacterized Ntn-hydrolase superfamily protein